MLQQSPTDPGRLTRAAIHCPQGEVEVRMTTAGNWQLAIRPEGAREWRLACSGDLDGGAITGGAQAERSPLRIGALLVDLERREVWVGDRCVKLSNMEYRLLAMLAGDPSRVFEKKELLREVWGCEGIITRTLDSHASRLRVKLRRAGAPGYVLNAHGVGYRLWDG